MKKTTKPLKPMTKGENAFVQMCVFLAKHHPDVFRVLMRSRYFVEGCSALSDHILNMPPMEREVMARPKITITEAEQYMQAAFEEMCVAHEEVRRIKQWANDMVDVYVKDTVKLNQIRKLLATN